MAILREADPLLAPDPPLDDPLLEPDPPTDPDAAAPLPSPDEPLPDPESMLPLADPDPPSGATKKALEEHPSSATTANGANPRMSEGAVSRMALSGARSQPLANYAELQGSRCVSVPSKERSTRSGCTDAHSSAAPKTGRRTIHFLDFVARHETFKKGLGCEQLRQYFITRGWRH
jgi:hypothetical protein